MNLFTSSSLLLFSAVLFTRNQVYPFLFLTLFYFFSIFCFAAEELEFIRINPTLWNIHSVLNVLYSLVDKSNINQQLEVRTPGTPVIEVTCYDKTVCCLGIC